MSEQAELVFVADDPVGLSIGDLVTLEVGVGEPEPKLAIPRSAVVEINGQDVVFVQKTGESFTRRRVELGVRDATHVEVRSGLDVGEMVVVEGGATNKGFLIDLLDAPAYRDARIDTELTG